jgi:hypothetical protein
MEQTAVEWIEGYLKKYNHIEDSLSLRMAFKQAYEMFEQQIKDAYQTSYISMMTEEQYYNETFKQKP